MSSLIYIEAQEDTPMVKQEPLSDSNKIIISGVSMPENTLDFYVPLLEQLTNLCAGTKGNLLDFHLEYMNSMSNKQVIKLISTLAKNDPELRVIWKFTNGDDLIKLKGEEMKSLLSNISFIIEEAVKS
ncbi:MAG: SiaC family regulatory phosphoprotein [Bacteroidia bacterium]|nr:SiaC family regulatory phosphoprotein [Bacteroidia bacterium]